MARHLDTPITFIPSIDLYSEIENASLTGVLKNGLSNDEFLAISVNIANNEGEEAAGSGNHWVYTLLYKIRGDINAMIINSLGDAYSNGTGQIKAKIDNKFNV
jgi:hypothetical protein